MKMRKLGPGGPEVSALGFGVMRMPVTVEGKIDRKTGREMILESWKSGVNYWDTAWPYHGGDSEVFIGELFADPDFPDREEITLASKMPSWLVKETADLEKIFDTQLERLGTDYFDVYLLHALNAGYWKSLKELGALEWLRDKKESGRVKYIGFSFHDGPEAFIDIVEGFEWDVCQIQFNFMDENEQAGRAGLKHAHELGLGVIIMEPLQGGNLVMPPRTVSDVWAKSAHPEWTPVERSLHWIWDQEEVGIILSGMSTMDHVKENCAAASDAVIDAMDDAERNLYPEAREAYFRLKAIGCTACRYCLPCPQDVDIPRNFGTYNQAAMYGNIEGARGSYRWMKSAFDQGLSKEDPRAEHCISCAVCEERCPQSLKIATLMPEVAAVLSGQKEPAEAAV